MVIKEYLNTLIPKKYLPTSTSTFLCKLSFLTTFKALNLYESWRRGGPPGSKYSVSKTGWFLGFHFETWFFELMLPILRRRLGRKLLIGDNLSSHLSVAVIEACR